MKNDPIYDVILSGKYHREKMHHKLDVYPIPREKEPMFINEPWLIDQTLLKYPTDREQSDKETGNIRVYIPLDINRDYMLRRRDALVAGHREANEVNEMSFSVDVAGMISQVEIIKTDT